MATSSSPSQRAEDYLERIHGLREAEGERTIGAAADGDEVGRASGDTWPIFSRWEVRARRSLAPPFMVPMPCQFVVSSNPPTDKMATGFSLGRQAGSAR